MRRRPRRPSKRGRRERMGTASASAGAFSCSYVTYGRMGHGCAASRALYRASFGFLSRLGAVARRRRFQTFFGAIGNSLCDLLLGRFANRARGGTIGRRGSSHRDGLLAARVGAAPRSGFLRIYALRIPYVNEELRCIRRRAIGRTAKSADFACRRAFRKLGLACRQKLGNGGMER